LPFDGGTKRPRQLRNCEYSFRGDGRREKIRKTRRARDEAPLIDNTDSFDRQRLPKARIKFEQHRAKN
jgi:hypothetical protein